MGMILHLPLSERHSDLELALLKLGIHRAQSRQPCKKRIFCAAVVILMKQMDQFDVNHTKKCVFFTFPLFKVRVD